jgi:hypothetical protein
MTAFEEKHNVKQQQMQISIQPHGSDPNLEMSLEGQQCNHIGNQNFDILIFEQDLTFGGLGEPRSAH